MRKAVQTHLASKGEGPYSQAIISGGFVFVSGQGPLDPTTDAIIGMDIEEQAAHTLHNVKRIVEAAGSSMNDVVQVTVYLARMSEFHRFNEVYRKFFDQPMPARSCTEAGLDGILVEISAIAALPRQRI